MFGEAAVLRRGDIDLKKGEIRVTRAVQWVDGKRLVVRPRTLSVKSGGCPQDRSVTGQVDLGEAMWAISRLARSSGASSAM